MDGLSIWAKTQPLILHLDFLDTVRIAIKKQFPFDERLFWRTCPLEWAGVDSDSVRASPEVVKQDVGGGCGGTAVRFAGLGMEARSSMGGCIRMANVQVIGWRPSVAPAGRVLAPLRVRAPEQTMQNTAAEPRSLPQDILELSKNAERGTEVKKSDATQWVEELHHMTILSRSAKVVPNETPGGKSGTEAILPQ